MAGLAIIEPLYSGLSLIDAANGLGRRVFVLSHNRGDRAFPIARLQNVAELVEVETNDEQAVVEALMRLHALFGLDAVIPGSEFHVPVAARAAHRLGLPGLPVETVDVIRFKHRMRERLRDSGVRAPCFRSASTLKDLRKAAEDVGFPAVLKPIDSAGSVHVSKVATEAQLLSAYETLLADTRMDLGRRLGPAVVLEAYIPGPEFSVEGYLFDGAPVFLSITEKLLGPEPYFVECGHIVEANLTPPVKDLIQAYVRDVIRALHVTLGAFHCEVRLGPDGPVAIELAARLAGDHICDLISLACGVSLPRMMIESYLGIAGAPAERTPRRFAGIRYLTAPNVVSYDHVSGIEELRAQSGFEAFSLLVVKGDVIPPATDFRGRVACAIFTADDYATLRSRLFATDRLVAFHRVSQTTVALEGACYV